jgi:hypothetical protein
MESPYLRIIELLESEVASIEPKEAVETLHPEIESLTYSILGEVKDWINIPDLEQRLHSHRDIDTGLVRKVYDLLSEASKQGQLERLISPSGNVIDPDEQLRVLLEHLDTIGDKQRKLGLKEVQLRLEMLLDGVVEKLLMTVPAAYSGLQDIKQLVSEKMSRLCDDDVMLLWAGVQKDFRSDEHFPAFQLDDEAKRFLEIGGIGEVRAKLAEYLVVYRPQLKRRAIEEQRTVWLHFSPGIARLLTLKDGSDLQPITHDEVNFLRALHSIAVLWHGCLGQNPEQLSQFLGTLSDGFVVTGEGRKLLEKTVRYDGRQKAHSLLIQLRKVLSYGEILGKPVSGVEESLWAHKLGLEVSLPDSRKELGVREEIIQRRLCKFLVERGIQAFGTKFGQSQIDLLLQRGGEQYVVETKKYKGRVTGRQIKKDLVQLQMYMSQKFTAPRGVLLIYNLTDTVIYPPSGWIKGRFYILAINLGIQTPSRKERSIHIEIGNGKELVNCVEVDAASSLRRSSKRPNRAKKVRRTGSEKGSKSD